MKKSSHRADVQGLRAVAVLLVLFFHIETRLRGGYLGVDMFFVISGFVIASSTLHEVNETNTFSWGAFLHRRVRRLIPGMAFTSVFTAVASLLLLSPFGPQKATAKMLVSAATYTSNFVLMPQNYFSLDPKANPLLHLWSLAVEEQFYFLWPLIIIGLLVLRARISTRSFQVALWSATFVTLLFSGWLFFTCTVRGAQVSGLSWFKIFAQRNISPEHFAFYSPFTRAWEFIAGVIVALLMRNDLLEVAKKLCTLSSVGGLFLVILGLYWATQHPEVQHGESWSTNTSATLAVVAGTSLLLIGGSKVQVLSSILKNRLLTTIGDCSYGIYLLHWPIWVLLITSFGRNVQIQLIAFVISIAAGWLQFHLLEEPVRSRKKFPSISTIRFVGSFGFAAVGIYFLMNLLTPMLALQLTGKESEALMLHVVEKPCMFKKYELGAANSCVFAAEDSQGVAVLVGDSMAKSLSDGFVQAANSMGLEGYVFTFPGCAFQLYDSPFSATDECSSWRKDVNTSLQQLHPSVVLIANLNALYVENPLPNWSAQETQNIWGSELTRTLNELSQLQTQIIVVQPPPRFDYDLRYDISLLGVKSVKESRAVVVGRRELMNGIEENAMKGIGFAQPILNFTELFCNEASCSPKGNNEFLFEDEDHLSVDGSLWVEGEIKKSIERALNK